MSAQFKAFNDSLVVERLPFVFESIAAWSRNLLYNIISYLGDSIAIGTVDCSVIVYDPSPSGMMMVNYQDDEYMDIWIYSAMNIYSLLYLKLDISCIACGDGGDVDDMICAQLIM